MTERAEKKEGPPQEKESQPSKKKGPPSLIEARVFVTTIVLLGILMIGAGVASYVIPAGKFREVAQGGKAVGEQGKKVQEKGKTVRVYERIPSTPIPVWKIALAPLLSVTGKNGPKIIVLILFILIIGGSFAILNKSGILPSLLTGLVDRFADQKTLFLIVTVTLFALLGSTLGILEEVVPMILIFVPIAYRMGWDSVTGMAIPFLSAGFGFAAAMFNPFTVGTAQKLAEVPLFSGLSLRVPLFLLSTTMVILYLWRYTRRIEARPQRSPTWESDQKRREELQPAQRTVEVPHPQRAVVVILLCFALIVGVVVSGTFVPPIQELSFPLIALIFLLMGVGVGLVSGVGGGKVARYFGRGLLDFAPAIGLILMAASVGYLIEIGNTMDSILHFISQNISGLSKGVAAVSLYFFQMLMNMLVPSGTGQAVLTIPILAPLGDLIGITRQTVVLAFQCGDGFSNLIWPTNPMLLIALGLAGVSYKSWLKWVLPLQLCLLVLSVLFLLLAVQIQYH